MKSIVALVSLLLIQYVVFSQPGILKKDTLTKILPADDYSVSKKAPGSPHKRDSFFVALSTAANTIAVINDKIYRIDAPEYVKLRKDNILAYTVISDASSLSGIKYILMIKTKPE